MEEAGEPGHEFSGTENSLAQVSANRKREVPCWISAVGLGWHRSGRHQKGQIKPLCHMKGYASPHGSGRCMHGCKCTPKLTGTCSSAWGWTHHPLQMSVCPSSHLLSLTVQFYVEFHPGFPLLLIPLLSPGHQWMSFQFLP